MSFRSKLSSRERRAYMTSQWADTNEDFQKKYGGKVICVLIRTRQLLSVGDDHLEALRKAQQHPNWPGRKMDVVLTPVPLYAKRLFL